MDRHLLRLPACCRGKLLLLWLQALLSISTIKPKPEYQAYMMTLILELVIFRLDPRRETYYIIPQILFVIDLVDHIT